MARGGTGLGEGDAGGVLDGVDQAGGLPLGGDGCGEGLEGGEALGRNAGELDVPAFVGGSGSRCSLTRGSGFGKVGM